MISGVVGNSRDGTLRDELRKRCAVNTKVEPTVVKGLMPKELNQQANGLQVIGVEHRSRAVAVSLSAERFLPDAVAALR